MVYDGSALHKRATCLLVVLLLSLMTSTSTAYAQLADRLTERSLRRNYELYRPWSYTNEKDKQARTEGSSWSAIGAIGAGLDSNIFESRQGETQSLVYDGILQLEHRRYPTASDRLRLTFTSPFRVHTASSMPNEFFGRARADWRHEHSKNIRFGVEGEFKYENDNVVNPEGFSAIRDFEHAQYVVTPSLDLRFGEGRLRLAYRVRYRDYVSTAGLPALDFWQHGPTIKYRHDTSETTRVKFTYQFRQESYGSNPARTRTGATLMSNPNEQHHLHRAHFESRWRPKPALDLSLGYGYIRKDDRFQGFESFDDHLIWARAQWYFLPEAEFSLTIAQEFRNYDNRPSGSGRTLKYDRLFVSPAIRWEVNDRFAVFAYYTINDRNTNRNFGNSFRDFEIHRFIYGTSFAL